MLWSGRPSRTPIGLVIGSRWIKAAQLSGGAGRWRLEAAALIRREEPETDPSAGEVARLRQALERQGFAGRRTVAAAPAEKLISGVLELPPADSGAPREQIARMELATMHRADPHAMEMCLWDLPGGGREGQTPRVMAVACAHADADAMLDALEQGGLRPLALDSESAAAVRAADEAGPAGRQILAIADLGWRSATLVMAFGRTIIYERRLEEFGVRKLWRKLSEAFELEAEVTDCLLNEVGLDEARLAGEAAGEAEPGVDAGLLPDVQSMIREHYREIGREMLISFSYARHQCPDGELGGLRLAGGGAAIPGMCGYLAEQTDLDVRRLCPRDLATCQKAAQPLADHPALTTAVGLAMHGQER